MVRFKWFLFLSYGMLGFALDPAFKANYVPVVIVDSTQLNDPENIYFISHGLDECGLPCYLVPDAEGVCQYVYPNPNGSPSSAQLSVSLQDLPPATNVNQTDPAYLIYMPINSSARGYISIYNPMSLATIFNPALDRQVLDIDDSDGTSLTDPNFYTFYQDFEFGLVYPSALNLTSQLFLNLSWVDYFCLPMQLQVFSYPSNTLIQGDATLVSGFNPSMSRDSIVTSMQSLLNKGESPWANLPVYYFQNQYTDTTPQGTVRILAAKNSIALAASSRQFVGPEVTPSYFPSDFVHNSLYGPTSSTTYMESVYTYYTNASNALTCQIFPAMGDPSTEFLYKITATPNDPSYNLIFTYVGAAPSSGPIPPPSISLSLNNLSTSKLLSGSVWPFVSTGGDPVPFTNELSKMISALFTIGQLPFTAALNAAPPASYNCVTPPSPTTFVNNNCGFARISIATGQTASYFLNPFAEGPWYNVYDQALHSFEVSQGEVPNNPSSGLGYGYDFDDLLNMAGLVQPLIQDLYANPAANGTPPLTDAYIVITLGNLSGSPILNINNDTYTTNPNGYQNYQTIPYSVNLGARSSATTMQVSLSWFDGTSTQTVSPPLSGATPIPNIVADPEHPMQITFVYNSVTYVYTINLLRQIVTLPVPSGGGDYAPYSTVDQFLIGNISFKLSDSVITIEISTVEPPWPG